ncbi:MAG: HlyD family type I secretion periplasmic adaptor subunit [Pseudohongiellaceae bacterium]
MTSSSTKRPDLPKKFNTDLTHQSRTGLIIFILLFGLGGIWATSAPINGAAIASGTVMVRSYSKTVQHLEGGIINDIFVENGARVEEGEPILDIDNTQSLAQLEIANSRYIALKALESRLISERDGDADLSYDAEILSRGDRAREEADAQVEIFRARQSSRQGQIQVLEQRIDQLESQRKGLEGLQESKGMLSVSYQEELKDIQELLSQGFSDKNRLRQLERSVAQLDGEVAELVASIASTDVQIGESRLQIIQLEKDFHNDVVTQLASVQTELNDVVEQITALEDIVSRTIIRAPTSGLVNGLQVHTLGGVIAPGMRIVDIVPDTEDLVVEAQVDPIDIDRVSIGQDATIRFSTFGSGTVPTVFGKVINLSAESLVNQTTGIPYYLARVEVTTESLEELGNLTLLPGMPAEVFIATGSRTLMQYLFKPFSNALARGLRED